MEKRVIEEFCRLADEGRLAERLREQASVYAKGRRLDGGVWWDTVVSRGGWKLEKHKVFNWYRVMGPDGKSHAGGSANFISRRIMGISINKLTAWATALRDGGVPETELEQVRAEFRRLVDAGKLAARLDAQPSANFDQGTWGGHACWDDLISYRGWRVQQHKLFKNCRVLDPHDVRRACGCRAYVFDRIMNRSVNLAVAYLRDNRGEDCFAVYPAGCVPKSGTVILLHGWGCRAVAMEQAAKGFAQFGYDAYCYDYRSSEADLTTLAEHLLADVAELRRERLGDAEKVHFLTHSMGGLVLRKALELDADGVFGSGIGRIVMMGPPNQGSLMADLAVAAGVGAVNRSIGDMTYLGDGAVRRIRPPRNYDRKIGIIAGTMDGKVLPGNSVHIPGMIEDRDYALIRICATHPGLRSSFEALSQAENFFRTGDFAG